MIVLVIGADAGLVAAGLERAGVDGDAIVLDPSAANLEAAERLVRDPRAWFLIGDAAVVPLPDDHVDQVVGADPGSGDLPRVLRSPA
jgi:hypothetical protein